VLLALLLLGRQLAPQLLLLLALLREVQNLLM
jgi:hypothetical protein